MKKIVAMLSAVIMCASMISTVAAMNFSDVTPDAWYYEDVEYAVEQGLINGKTEDTFCPDDMLTYAEAIKLAACMNQLYNEGVVTLSNGNPWYKPYEEYCFNNEIIHEILPWGKQVTRSEYIEVFARALPEEAYEEINNIPDDAIPDVKMGELYYESVYKMYRAGILTGSGEQHLFKAKERIRRSEVAAILARMMNPERRVQFDLVDAEPLVFTKQPEYVDAKIGDTVSFEVQVSGGKTPYKYTWEKSQDGQNWVDMTILNTSNGVRTEELTIKDLSQDDFDTYYMFRCVVKDADGEEIISDIAKLVQIKESEQDNKEEDKKEEDKKEEDKKDENVWVEVNVGTVENPESDIIIGETNTYIPGGNVVLLDPIKISKQPENFELTETTPRAGFKVEVEGGVPPYTYQWEMNTDMKGTSVWVKMPEPDVRAIRAGTAKWRGSESENLIVLITEENVLNMSGTKFRCVITDSKGAEIITNPVGFVKNDTKVNPEIIPPKRINR